MKKHPEFGSPNFAISMLRQVSRFKKTTATCVTEDKVDLYKENTYKQLPEKDDSKILFRKAKNNAEVIRKMCESMGKHDLNIAHITAQGEGDADEYGKIDNWVKKIYEQSAETCLIVVLFAGFGKESNGCCFLHIKSF